MLARTLLLVITFNTISTYNCFGMENNNNTELKNAASIPKDEDAIILDRGLLTVIPGKIIKEGEEPAGFLQSPKTITTIDTRNTTILDLLYYNESLGYHKKAYFNPHIIKAFIQKPIIVITRLQQLGYTNENKQTRRGIKEAIRERQALYWPYKKGVIIYSIEEQPSIDIIKHVKKMLDNGTYQETILK